MMASAQGKQVNLSKFKQFCENHPRLIRRLRERLPGYEKPEAVIQFLADNKDVPCRLTERGKLEDDKRHAEFPILPPQNQVALAICSYPDWRSESLGSTFEDFDVFVCARAWVTYAQVPVPDPEVDYDPTKFDRLKHRRPPMNAAVFRGYPARMQAFVAEELQKDGWFDGSGWTVDRWFDSAVVVGAGSRYDSGTAWAKSHDLCRTFGQQNYLYAEPKELKTLEDEAARQGDTSDAAKKLKRISANESNRHVTQFDNLFQQTRVEQAPETVAARKAVFEVEHSDSGDLNVVNTYVNKVFPQWLDLLLRNPAFRKIDYIQEETYELQAKFFREVQIQDFRYKGLCEFLVKEMATRALSWWPSWPQPGAMECANDVNGSLSDSPRPRVVKQLLDKKGLKIFPIRAVEGPFDQMFLLEGPGTEALKRTAMVLARQVIWPPPPTDPCVPDFAVARFVIWPLNGRHTETQPEIGLGIQTVWPMEKPYLSADSVTALEGTAGGGLWPTPTFLMLSSAEDRRILTRFVSQRRPPSGQGWTPLLEWSAVIQGRNAVPWLSRGQEPPQVPE
jgi:hypothetical protein